MTLSPLFSRTRQGYPPSALAGDAPTTAPATAASDAMSVATASAARLGTVGDWWMVMGITPSVLAIVDSGRSGCCGPRCMVRRRPPDGLDPRRGGSRLAGSG